jgi:hypothetical protein
MPDAAEAITLARVKPEFYWTWRLLWEGFSAEECQQIRHLDDQQMMTHLLQALDQKIPVDPGWILEPDQLDRLDQVLGKARPHRIRPLLEKLPEELTREHVELYLHARDLLG